MGKVSVRGDRQPSHEGSEVGVVLMPNEVRAHRLRRLFGVSVWSASRCGYLCLWVSKAAQG